VIDFFVQLGGFIMAPLYWVTSIILSGFHQLLTPLLGYDSGWNWVLSIMGLTIVIRAALIPLFVKQIKSSRNMQLIQPKVRELTKKYGHDRERLAQEQMKLYKESGTNPFASCLPLLVQMPIFIALFRVIDGAANGETRGVLTQAQVDSLASATWFGARIADRFTTADSWQVMVLAGVLVLGMTATTFLTQRQLMSKNMPADALSGPYARQQKLLLYVLPVVFAVGGIAFPIGVLVYWTTSNLWTMCQQFYVIRNNPAPNTSAFAAKQARMAKKAARKGEPVEATSTDAVDPATGHVPEAETPAPAPRQQPKKQPRSQRKKPAPQQARKSGPTNAPKNVQKKPQQKPQQKRPGNQPKK
jgi:YidC/Oxa1 family membrane protein insertase